MAYVVPSVLVYQMLEEAGGVLGATPDLDAVIVGPLYNIVSSADSEESAALSGYGTVGGDTKEWSGNVVEDFSIFAPSSQVFMELANRQPGQQVEVSSVNVLFGNTVIEANRCTIKVNDSVTPGEDRNVITKTGTYGGSPSVPCLTFETSLSHDIDQLILGQNSVKPGDRALVKGSIDGDQVEYYTVVTAVVPNDADKKEPSIRFADEFPMGTAANEPLTISFLRNIGVHELTSTVDVTKASSEGVIGFDAAQKVDVADIISAEVFVGYRALRVDKSSTILSINDTLERAAVLGEASEMNPLALAVELALANSGVARIKALSITEDTLAGYQLAMDLLESEHLAYAITPLTQDESIVQALTSHANSMSVPEEAGWRVVLANTAIRDFKYVVGSNVSPLSTDSLP